MGNLFKISDRDCSSGWYKGNSIPALKSFMTETKPSVEITPVHAVVEELPMSVDELDSILKLQQSIFAQVASNVDYKEVLEGLCSMAQALLPNSAASIMVLNDSGKRLDVLCAPAVPPEGQMRLSGIKPGSGTGSCGNAVMCNQPVFVRDTFTDQRWDDLRDIAYDFNLCACWSMPVRDNDGQPIGSFALSSFEHRMPSAFHKRLLDVGASMVNIVLSRQRQEEQLHNQQQQLISALESDALTGLPNQSKLMLQLRAGIDHKSLILLNLDNFSYINTAYGPAFGDRFLCEVAAELQQFIAGAGDLFRVNADEFALLYTGRQDLNQRLESLQHYFFSQPLQIDEQSFSITFTAGAATAQVGVLGQAIRALSQARSRGKNRFHIYDAIADEPDQEARLAHIRWNSYLHEALNHQQLVPFFQGIRDNRTGEITRYEALVRLQRDNQSYTPYHFLDVAQHSGLLPSITREMINKGLAAIQGSATRLSFNITEDDLTRHWLQDYLLQKTAEYRVDPGQITLEILEGVSASGKKNHIRQLNSLKEMGFQLAIDDFGTEYSNFERILELQVDLVKVDSKYIRHIDTDPKSYEITKAIVYFAKNAGIATVAEFVHNQAVQDVVESLGIDYSQGYLFSEPQPDIQR